jgi:hypothetical protein
VQQKKCSNPVFAIFGHFRIAFSPIFLGVQIHVIPQKKVTFLYLKKPFVDWCGLASVFLETVFRETIFFIENPSFLLTFLQQKYGNRFYFSFKPKVYLKYEK